MSAPRRRLRRRRCQWSGGCPARFRPTAPRPRPGRYFLFQLHDRAWWRSLKHHWLYLNQLDTLASVERLVGFYVKQHNSSCLIPLSAGRRRTRCISAPAPESRMTSPLPGSSPAKPASPPTGRSPAKTVVHPHLKLSLLHQNLIPLPFPACCTCTRPTPECPDTQLCSFRSGCLGKQRAQERQFTFFHVFNSVNEAHEQT